MITPSKSPLGLILILITITGKGSNRVILYLFITTHSVGFLEVKADTDLALLLLLNFFNSVELGNLKVHFSDFFESGLC